MNMKKFLIVAVALFCLLILNSAVFAGKVQLPEDTPVKVKFDSSMKINSGKVQEGIPLLIYLAEDIKIGGKTIVEAGAQGKAEVIEIKKSSKPGKPGFIKVAFRELDAKGEYKTLDGAPIKITGEIYAKGSGKKLLSYLFIFGLFIKGSQGEIKTDQIYNAKIAETIILQSE